MGLPESLISLRSCLRPLPVTKPFPALCWSLMSPLSDLAQRNYCSLSWMPGFGSWQFPLLTLRSQNPELSHRGGPSGLPSSGTCFLAMRRWSHGDPTCISQRRKYSPGPNLHLMEENVGCETQPASHRQESGTMDPNYIFRRKRWAVGEDRVMGAPPASHRGEGGAAGPNLQLMGEKTEQQRPNLNL